MKSKSGYLTSFYNMGDVNKTELVFWEDDGTRDRHMTIFYRDVPVGTCVLINESGFINFIRAFCGAYKAFGYDTDKLKAIIKEENI